MPCILPGPTRVDKVIHCPTNKSGLLAGLLSGAFGGSSPPAAGGLPNLSVFWLCQLQTCVPRRTPLGSFPRGPAGWCQSCGGFSSDDELMGLQTIDKSQKPCPFGLISAGLSLKRRKVSARTVFLASGLLAIHDAAGLMHSVRCDDTQIRGYNTSKSPGSDARD